MKVCPFCKVELGRAGDEHGMVADGRIYCNINLISWNPNKLGIISSLSR
jgi:hypothetical protein